MTLRPAAAETATGTAGPTVAPPAKTPARRRLHHRPGRRKSSRARSQAWAAYLFLAPWFIGLAGFVAAQAALFGANDTARARACMMEALPALQAGGDPT